MSCSDRPSTMTYYYLLTVNYWLKHNATIRYPSTLYFKYPIKFTVYQMLQKSFPQNLLSELTEFIKFCIILYCKVVDILFISPTFELF